jgi:methyl-accepting chemotaxis protein
MENINKLYEESSRLKSLLTEFVQIELSHYKWARSVKDFVFDESVSTLNVELDHEKCQLGLLLYDEERRTSLKKYKKIDVLLDKLIEPHYDLHIYTNEIKSKFGRISVDQVKTIFYLHSDQKLEEVQNLLQKIRMEFKALEESNIEDIKIEQRNLISGNWILILIIMIVSLLIALFLSFLITKPIMKTRNRLLEISQGEGDLTKKLEIHSKDEIGMMAMYFNRFIDYLNIMIIRIKQSINETKNISYELSSTSEQTMTALKAMRTSIEKVNEDTYILDRNANNTKLSSHKINVFIKELVNLVDSQTSLVDISSKSIEEMMKSIINMSQISESKSKTAHILQKNSKESEKDIHITSQKINKVAESAQTIIKMIDIINDIADQTNLLAMNASIEAARAGKAGLGFNIVAQEIRQLAENTSLHSDEISNNLENIVDSIRETKGYMDDMSKVFVNIIYEISSIAESMGEVKNSSKNMENRTKQVNGSLDELIHITNQVRKSSKETNDRISEINSSVSNLSSLSQELKDRMNELSSGIKEIFKSTENLTQLGIKGNENVTILEQLVDNFKVKQEGDLKTGITEKNDF